ncbi:unnamed protein product [Cuscuta campestris]|uniref:CCHC-type domain-containing protein n=1 Tax=Cuscuta campestris TaxID=132261 RepID=A0A484K948_9ASTE|nr:unnamed protein product [Cuscuta campestris]
MFERFSKIVNDLHALKKTYTDKELVRKILRSLTPEWQSKADAIQESIGITNVTIDGLRGNLKTYESTILYPSLGEQKKNGIALKASASQERAMEDSSDEDEFGIVLKKFHKFMSQEYERKGKKEGGPSKCYGCGEVGHIKPKCPNAKNKKKMFKKYRAYISWGGDSGDESSEGKENESANLCLIAHEEPPEEEVKENDLAPGRTLLPPRLLLHHRRTNTSTDLSYGSTTAQRRRGSRRSLSTKKILPPRFSTARFIHDSIPHEARVILERGNFLDLLYIKKAHYQPFLVRAFYSNLKKDEDGALISNFNGVDIYLNEENTQILTGIE